MKAMQQLLEIMAQLRDPETGCPWDLKQTYASIVPYTLEEAYEVADAIHRGDMHELRDELGDLLFQVVFYSQIAREQGQFDFEQVVNAINDKMLRRHPHVFGEMQYESEEQLHQAWEATKAKERQAKQQHQQPASQSSSQMASQMASQMDGVARALPALIRGEKLQKRAARVGFDWPDKHGALAKLQEEINEVQAEMEAGTEAGIKAGIEAGTEAGIEAGIDKAESGRLQDELGDLLFSIVNVVRLCGMDAEQTMSQANEKFERRFRQMEQKLHAQGVDDLHQLTPEQWDQAWEAVKRS